MARKPLSEYIGRAGRKALSAIVGVTLALMGIGIGGIGATSCSDDTEWNETPQKIQEFLAQYFPGQGVSAYTHTEGEYKVSLKNSATLTFNEKFIWTSADGNGSPLPPLFVSDQLPPQFVEEYLQVTDNVDRVYRVERKAGIYTVELQNSTVTYNDTTGEVTNGGIVAPTSLLL